MERPIPSIDDETRGRLRTRFGEEVDRWLDEVPALLATLRERWAIDLEAVIPHGSRSIIIRCTTADGRAAILKTAPDRDRVALEAAALSTWTTHHVPAVYAIDTSAGAVLLELVEPGGMLRDAAAYPSIELVGALVGALHEHGRPAASFPRLTTLVASLFDSWVRPRTLHPELVELVSEDLFERARRFAVRLAAEPSSTVLLHGDLTPVNVLDGGSDRGLVAIDPAPCLGDPAYDAIDLLVWRATDVATIEARAAELATALGLGVTRLLDWCTAFAAMFALDVAGPGQRHADDWCDAATPFLVLASEVPS